jgi:hypothetical protein
MTDTLKPWDAQQFTDKIIAEVRAVMRRDDACKIVVPSDLRTLIGEIDRLRDRLNPPPQPAPVPVESREAFEVWAAGHGFDVKMYDEHTYIDTETRRAWFGWQAALSWQAAAAPTAQPERLTEEERKAVEFVRVNNKIQMHKNYYLVELLRIIDRLTNQKGE